jgi:hypothetical protein
MKKYNWRYYVCKGSKNKNAHIIQHRKYLSLHIEANSKKEVYKKLNKFIKYETKKTIYKEK